MLTLAGVALQSLGREFITPPFNVVDRSGARLVDIAAGEWSRVLTAAFVSSFGWPHALLNVAGAVLVARPLERRCGTRVLVTVFVASAVAAFSAGVLGHGVHWLSAGGSGFVLGCAGYLTARWSRCGQIERVAIVVVLATTFALPAIEFALGEPTRWSLPAHAGGFAAGLFVGIAGSRRAQAAVALAVTVMSVAALLPTFLPLLPGEPHVMKCRGDARSATTGADTRIMYLSDRDDISIRALSPTGRPVPGYVFSPERRGRMPWYGYSGAVYEVLDSHGTCLMRVRATRATSTVRITG
ncbi:MAG: rhomboid family intramembrane serine protease [Microthrixaceae bacterium]